MNIAPTLVTELARQGIAYDIIEHPYSIFSLNTAHTAHIPDEQMVKSVVFEDNYGYVLALVPANRQVKIRELNQVLRRTMGLASEQELASLFVDCDPGAIPPIGYAYDIETVVDFALDDCDDVYIEAGNHEELLHLKGNSFRKLQQHARHANICVH